MIYILNETCKVYGMERNTKGAKVEVMNRGDRRGER